MSPTTRVARNARPAAMNTSTIGHTPHRIESDATHARAAARAPHLLHAADARHLYRAEKSETSRTRRLRRPFPYTGQSHEPARHDEAGCRRQSASLYRMSRKRRVASRRKRQDTSMPRMPICSRVLRYVFRGMRLLPFRRARVPISSLYHVTRWQARPA